MRRAWIAVAYFGLLCGALTAHAGEKSCTLQISGNDIMQYDKTELRVAADCTQVTLTLRHTGKLPAQTMGHTWVLTAAADMQGVLNAGLSAGVANSYVPPKDPRVIAATRIVGGGQSTSVTFATRVLKKGGDYSYFCSFPGHAALMKGKLIFG